MVYLSKRIGEVIKGHSNFIQLILQEYKEPEFAKCPPFLVPKSKHINTLVLSSHKVKLSTAIQISTS